MLQVLQNNFLKRFLSTTTLGIICVFFILFKDNIISTLMFLLIVAILSIISIYEFSSMLKKIHKNILCIEVQLFSLFFIFSTLIDSLDLFKQYDIRFFVIIVFVIFCWLRILFTSESQIIIERIAWSVLTIFLITIPLSFIIPIYIYDNVFFGNDIYLFLFFIIVVKSSDIGGYLFGNLSNVLMNGNHKIFSKLSPKKSIEGIIGSLALSLFFSLIVGVSVMDFDILYLILIGITMCVCSITGDLLISAIKRITNCKQSGFLIPGIGGVLDLLDSFIIAAPAFYFLCKYLLLY